MEKLTPEQIGFVVKQVGEWLDIRNEKNLHTGFADACHSALLNRLLNGDKPLPKPPPKQFSYPSYALGEGQFVTITEIWEHPDGGPVVIDQSPAWRWLDKDNGLLLHDNGDKFKYDPASKQLIKVPDA
jgi:hypothetical protein